MKKLLFILVAIIVFGSCVDHQKENYNHYTDIATIENASQQTSFFMKMDNDTRLKTIASSIAYYRPKDGQRVIANYSILSTPADSETYRYNVKLNDVYEILTKGIFKLTPETMDSIGNDPIRLHDMWIGGEYLNVEFSYPGYNRVHYINLISDSTKTYTDNRVHLEFRHNANDDYPSYSKWGMVSIDLRSLKATVIADSVNLTIHVKEFAAGSTDKSYNMTYRFGSQASTIGSRSLIIPANTDKAR